MPIYSFRDHQEMLRMETFHQEVSEADHLLVISLGRDLRLIVLLFNSQYTFNSFNNKNPLMKEYKKLLENHNSFLQKTFSFNDLFIKHK